MSLVIDSHVHHYPQEATIKTADWADACNEQYWKRLVLGDTRRKSIQGFASTEKLLNDMDEAGLDKVVLQGWY